MAATNRPARLNRTLLGLLGLVLLLAGAFGLVFGLGLLTGLLPGLDPAVPLLPQDVQLPSWVPYAVIVAAAVVGLLCLRWLLAQALRRPKTGTWRLHRDAARGTTVLDADTAADALGSDIEGYPGVHKARATLAGGRARPDLQLDVTLEEHTSVSELRTRISDQALPRLRQALELDDVPTELLLRVDAAGSASPRTH